MRWDIERRECIMAKQTRPDPLPHLHAVAAALAAPGQPGTLFTALDRAMVKLNAHDRAKLVVFAYETGLVVARSEAPLPARQQLAMAT